VARNQATLPVLSVAVFLVAWEIVGSGLNPILLATPSAVAIAFYQIIQDGTLAPAFLRAMEVLAVGFALAALLGIAIGVLMGRSPAANRVLSPYVSFFLATPLVGVVPLIVIWFGIDFRQRLRSPF
jgi:NitT/TauT family transport system permease protein